MEGPEGRDHLEAHPYSLGAAGGMGCPYGVTLAGVGVWQGAVLSCGLLPADGSLWCPYQTLAISLRWWFLQERTASPEESLYPLAGYTDVKSLFPGLYRGVLGWLRSMPSSVPTPQAAPCSPTCDTVAGAMESFLCGRGDNFCLMKQEPGGTWGDIWALGKLFQRIQNCWESNWQSK